MKSTRTLLIAFLTLVTAVVTAQPAGNLDPTFNGTGKLVYDKDNHDLYNDVKIQADGKIVAVGTYLTPTWSSGVEVTRYLTDGSFDPTFGAAGHYNYAGYTECGAYKSIIKVDGKILIGGYATDYTNWWMLLIQLNADGTPDATFGTNGIVTLNLGPGERIIYALAETAEGKILASGYSQNNEFKNVPVVVRFSETGALDTTFGIDGVASISVTEIDNEFAALAIQSDGKIVAAGHISNGMSWFSLLVARFDANGVLDATYGTGGIVNKNLNNVDDEFFDLQLTEDDEAILAGFTVTQLDLYYHLLVMKLDTTGTPVTNFGDNGMVMAGTVPYSFGDALALQTDGKIVIAGCTGNLMPDNNDWAIWRFNPDGSADSDFGTNGLVTTEFFGNADEALGVALYEDKIIVAGKTRNATNYLDFAIARYTNDVGVLVSELAKQQDVSVSPNPVKRNGTLTVSYELTQPENITIEVMNTSGSSVVNASLGLQTAGKQSVQVNLPSNLPYGILYLQIRGNKGMNKTSKVIVTN